MWKISQPVLAKLKQAISSQYRIIYLMAWDEERVEQILKAISRLFYKDKRAVIVWTATQGFHTEENNPPKKKDVKTQDPEAAIQHIATKAEEAIYLMKDLPAYFDNNDALVRMMRDLYSQLSNKNTLVMLSHPVMKIPEVLKKEIFLIELGLPDEQEIAGFFKHTLLLKNTKRTFTDDWVSQCASAMHGLTLNEVRHLVRRMEVDHKLGSQNALQDIYDEKAQVLLKESCLRVVPVRPSVSSIGGLDNLKEWVEKRSNLFSREALNTGVQAPGGVLFMGVSGCGKSLAAKAIASAWGLQLVRLDMNLILSGAYGPPELAFDQACRTAESLAPIVLWIDELENAFGYDENAAAGGNINIFSSFLTWMQEKPSSVFVAATANRIHRLPAEMLRKGRFDQLFFLDLPDEKERAEIFRVHIKLNGGSPDDFDMAVLTALTQGRSGAEIEQAVKSARIEAFAENRAFNQRDLSRSCGSMVPLSVTMQEQIKELRNWSYNRAMPASYKKDRQTPAKKGRQS